jgi:hypothetical protein
MGYNINQNFPLCKPTMEVFDLENSCDYDEWCVLYTNLLASFSLQNDTYNYLYTTHVKVILYSMNGQIYTTECVIISEVEIYEKVDHCSLDVLVNIVQNGKKTDVFLTKQGILRESSKTFVCPTDDKIIHFQNINKGFEIIKKNNLVTIMKRSEKKIGVNFEQISALVDYYNKIIENPTIKLTKDVSCLSALFILILALVIDKKHILKNLKNFLICLVHKRQNHVAIDSRMRPQYFPAPVLEQRALASLAPSAPIQNYNSSACDSSYGYNIYQKLQPGLTETFHIDNEKKKPARSASADNIKSKSNLINCEICGKVCQTKSGLGSHMRSHNS